MQQFKTLFTILVSILFLFGSCSSDDEYVKPTIIGTWVTGDRILKTDMQEHADFVKMINVYLAYDSQEDYTISTVYTERDMQTTATPKKPGLPTIVKQASDYTLEGDSIIIEDDNIILRAYCNIGEKILIMRRTVKKAEMELILKDIGTDPGIVPENFVGEYSTYEFR